MPKRPAFSWSLFCALRRGKPLPTRGARIDDCGGARRAVGRAVAKRDAPRVGRLPWDGHARTVRSPQHQLRGKTRREVGGSGARGCHRRTVTVGARLPKRGGGEGCRANAARVSTRAAAPYARQTRWLQRARTARRCGASSRDAGPSAAGVHEHGGRRPQCKARLQRPISSSLPRVRPYER